jgi:DNA (cytosine-5)-methyltransferase 1
MRYGSVCSGIEAATCAWHELGWTPAWFSEIAGFPSRLLAHHYPHVPNLGDMTKLHEREEFNERPIELLVGGTPCQSFSVAGLRGGMADPRGNLALVFLQIARRARPKWVVWENVPGVLSSNEGRDFGAFLGGLAELGYGFAYRVLDAQHFGVPQRRRRVFVVGYLGDWRRAAAVLFERQSLSGNPPPRRKTGQEVAGTLGGGSGERGWCDDLDRAGAFIPEVAGTVTRASARLADKGDRTPDLISDVARCLTSRNARNARNARNDGDTETYVTHTQRGEGFDASEDGTGRGTPLVPIPFDTTQITSAENRCRPEPGDPCHPLAASAAAPALAFNLRGREEGAQPEIDPDGLASLRAASGGSSRSYLGTATFVRRLTPRECEALQGFSRDYTLIPWRGKLAADGPRYQAIGNSMAVPCMRWLGERIAAVDRISNA